MHHCGHGVPDDRVRSGAPLDHSRGWLPSVPRCRRRCSAVPRHTRLPEPRKLRQDRPRGHSGLLRLYGTRGRARSRAPCGSPPCLSPTLPACSGRARRTRGSAPSRPRWEPDTGDRLEDRCSVVFGQELQVTVEVAPFSERAQRRAKPSAAEVRCRRDAGARHGERNERLFRSKRRQGHLSVPPGARRVALA